MTEERDNRTAELEPGVENLLRKAVLGSSPSTMLYLEFLAERAEILTHKWIESEKAGHDIGTDQALDSWVSSHRVNWLRHRIFRRRDSAKRN